MFSLKASNLLMLDEHSNHFNVGCIQCLTNALENWGGKDGAVVAILNDREFYEKGRVYPDWRRMRHVPTATWMGWQF